MFRDMELVRKILLNIAEGNLNGGVEGYTDDAVNIHKALVIDKGLVEGAPNYPTGKDSRPDIPDLVMISRLTWDGHDFIQGIATDTKWSKVKVFLTEAGKDVTIETIKWAVLQLFGAAVS
jgi:hypothetical protein